MAEESLLPAAFRDLECWADWALATETARNAKRLATPYPVLQAFYDAMLPRLDDLLAYLDAFPLQALTADGERLLLLSLSLAEVAPAIEQFGQAGVVDVYDPARFTPARLG